MKKIKRLLIVISVVFMAIVGNVLAAESPSSVIGHVPSIAVDERWNANDPGELLNNQGYSTFMDGGSIIKGKYSPFTPKKVPTAEAIKTVDSGYTIVRDDSQTYTAAEAAANGLTRYMIKSNGYKISTFASGITTFANTSLRFDSLYEIGGEEVDAVLQLDKVVTTLDNVYVRVYVNQTNVKSPYLGFGCYAGENASINTEFSSTFNRKDPSKNVAYCLVFATVKLYEKDGTPLINEKTIFYPGDIDGSEGSGDLNIYEIAKLPTKSNSNVFLPKSNTSLRMDSNGLISSDFNNSDNGEWFDSDTQKVSLVLANLPSLTNEGIVSYAHGWYFETNNTTFTGSYGQTDVTFLLPVVHVTYLSDDGGDITGAKDEDGNTLPKDKDGGANDTLADETLLYGDNPNGETDTLRKGYCKRTYWTADKPIVLDRRKTKSIAVGNHISDAELLIAKITEDTVFTLHHEKCADPVKDYDSNSAITSTSTTVKVGDIITYRITYANTSTTAQNIIITDTLSKGLQYVGTVKGSNAVKSGTATTGTIKFIDSNVPANTEGRVLMYKVKVTKDAVNFVENDASVKVGNDPAIDLNPLRNPLKSEVPVPDTASNTSGIIIAIGCILICSGAVFAYKKYKQN